jgi:hypothetical protein
MKTEVDDWLMELPPLDGDDDEPDSSAEVGEDLLPVHEDASSLDDSVMDDLDVGIGAEIPDEEPTAQPTAPQLSNVSKGLQPALADDDSWEADVGEPDLDLLDGEPTSEEDGEPPVEADGDFGDHEDLPGSEDDAGEEGTTDPIEHSLDEELPAMDADDEGDFEDTLLLEAGEVDRDLETLRWADVAWSESKSFHRSFPWVANESDAPVALASLAALQMSVALARSGELWISRDGGRTAHRAGGSFTHRVLPNENESPLFLSLAPSPDGSVVLWIGNDGGQLAASHDLGESFRFHAVGRPILSFATREDGSLIALARGDGAMELLTSTDGVTWFTQSASGDVAALARRVRARWMACRGAAVAVGDETGALVSRDGRHFTRVPGTAGSTAGVFAGVDAKVALVVSGPFGEDDEVHLVRVGHEGLPEIVAEVDASSPVLALAWLEELGAVEVLLASHALVWGPPHAK